MCSFVMSRKGILQCTKVFLLFFLTAGLVTVQKFFISPEQLNPGAPAALKTKVSHPAWITSYPCGGRNTSVTRRHLRQRKTSIRMWSHQNR